MKKKWTALARRAIALSCAIALCSTGPLSYADDTDSLRQETTSLQNQLNKLNQELNSLSSQITTLASQIEETDAEIEKAELDLAAAQLNEEIQYNAMKKRIKFMYETGNPSILYMLCSAESMADFLNRTEFIRSITEYDRKMLAELRVLHEEIAEKEHALQESREELLSMQTELDAQKNQLNQKINSTSVRLQASSEALANALAAQNAGGNSSGDSSTPSTPSKPTEKPPVDNVATDDLVLFAAILQCEAGTRNYDALLAVATVIMNRVESPRYPNTLYGVIYQRGQFSPTWNGSLKRVLAKGPASLCYTVARDALNGSRHNAVLGCYSFRASWTGHAGTIIGDNVFF